MLMEYSVRNIQAIGIEIKTDRSIHDIFEMVE